MTAAKSPGINHENRLVSIALPMLDAQKTIEKAITSVVWQTCREWELLVMDDGSSDGSVELAKSFSDPRIRVVADGVHRGLPGQLNRAVQMARGKYFARMDADDIAYPSRLEKQVKFLDSHEEVDLVGTWVVVFRADGILLGCRKPADTHGRICARPWAGIPMVHPTWMGRMGWFQKNPYRLDALRTEDQELLMRACRASRYANIPEILLGYREDSLSFTKILAGRRNACRIMAERAVKERVFLAPALGVTRHIARSMVEAVALSTGLNYKLLPNRARPTTPQECEEWQQIWAAIASTPTEFCAAPVPKAAPTQTQ